jgi:ATP-dependent Clp protease protease subunit
MSQLNNYIRQKETKHHQISDKKRYDKKRYDRKHKNGSDSESEEETTFPGMPDIAALLKKEKKKVFRDHNHIYFRCDVTMDKISKLCNLIEEYNREHDEWKHTITTAVIIPKPIYLHITSFGGDLIAGFLAYDYIKKSKIPIYTIAEGYTVSSGANMFMAGHRRFMTEHSYLLVHQLNETKCGRETFHDIVDSVANDLEFMTRLYGMYLNNIRHNRVDVPPEDILTKEKLENHMLHDIYWNYDTCKRYGLTDGLYTNYSDNDTSDIAHYLNDSSMEITSRPKLYSLKDLQPSAEIVKRIKENVSKQQKDVDAVEILKKHIAERLTTDKSSAILNTHDDTIEIKLDDNDSDKKRRRNKDQVIEKISKNLKKSRD